MATLELRDYLKAARLASDRARKVTVVLVIASVVVLIGMVNSMDHAWMERRLDRASNPDDPYVRNNIGPAPVQRGEAADLFKHRRELYEQRYHDFYSELMKSYIESGFGVRVPLFGVTIDANDLAAFGLRCSSCERVLTCASGSTPHELR